MKPINKLIKNLIIVKKESMRKNIILILIQHLNIFILFNFKKIYFNSIFI